MAEKTEAAAAVETEERYRVIIHSDGRPGGSRDVPIVVNGKIVLVRRDVEVLLTEPYKEALLNAKVRGYEGKSDVARYAVSINGKVIIPKGSLDVSPTTGLDGTVSDATA